MAITLLHPVEGGPGEIGGQLFKDVQGPAETLFCLFMPAGSRRLVCQFPQFIAELRSGILFAGCRVHQLFPQGQCLGNVPGGGEEPGQLQSQSR